MPITLSHVDLVCLPVEVELPTFLLAHELIHQVHHALSGKGGGWQRSVGFLLLEEGLAMRGTRALYPEVPVTEHLSAIDPAWTKACEERHQAILVSPKLNLEHMPSPFRRVQAPFSAFSNPCFWKFYTVSP